MERNKADFRIVLAAGVIWMLTVIGFMKITGVKAQISPTPATVPSGLGTPDANNYPCTTGMASAKTGSFFLQTDVGSPNAGRIWSCYLDSVSGLPSWHAPVSGVPVTNAGPTASVTLGGGLLSLGIQSVDVAWPGAVPGDIYTCGAGSATASKATMLNLDAIGFSAAAGTATLGVRNMGTGLLSATNVVNVACTVKLNY